MTSKRNKSFMENDEGQLNFYVMLYQLFTSCSIDGIVIAINGKLGSTFELWLDQYNLISSDHCTYYSR